MGPRRRGMTVRTCAGRPLCGIDRISCCVLNARLPRSRKLHRYVRIRRRSIATPTSLARSPHVCGTRGGGAGNFSRAYYDVLQLKSREAGGQLRCTHATAPFAAQPGTCSLAPQQRTSLVLASIAPRLSRICASSEPPHLVCAASHIDVTAAHITIFGSFQWHRFVCASVDIVI